MVEFLMAQGSQFKGDFPKIPLSSDIQLTEMGNDPFFVPLHVGRVYERSAVESLVHQISEKRPEGGWGHLHVSEFGTRYEPSAIRLLAATLAQDGTAWARGSVRAPAA